MLVTKILAMCGAGAITAGGLLLISPEPASAQPIFVTAPPPPQDVIVRHIKYGDLNLASDIGAARLNRRVGYAVSSLCSEATGDPMRSLFTSVPSGPCRASAWNQARPQIDRAVNRAREIASTGSSTIAAVGITISLKQK